MRADRVLLVDDEADFVDALAERMRTRGMRVEVAYRGVDALGLIAERDFDAIVLDPAMPGLEGIATLKAIRASRPKFQSMLLTGRGTIPKAVEATKLGARDVIEKPADLGVLLGKIKEARAARVRAEENESRKKVNEIMKSRGW